MAGVALLALKSVWLMCLVPDTELASSKEALLNYLVQSKNRVKENIESRDRWSCKEEDWRERKPLYGQFERHQERKNRSLDWLTGGDMKWLTEILLVAAQDQALKTLTVQMVAYHTTTSPAGTNFVVKQWRQWPL